jgi:hypothetical protein
MTHQKGTPYKKTASLRDGDYFAGARPPGAADSCVCFDSALGV